MSVGTLGKLSPQMQVIVCTRVSISVTKCPLALLPNFKITRASEYRQLTSKSVPQMLLLKKG